MTIKTYTSREIRENRFIEDDSVAIITSHGKPVKIAIPFNDRTLHEGLEKAFALHMVEHHILTQAKAAKLAGMSLVSFLSLMAEYNINAADQSKEEITAELSQFQ
ncbi:MAG: UPF0175 family protein [Thiohalomonadales bacterium]